MQRACAFRRRRHRRSRGRCCCRRRAEPEPEPRPRGGRRRRWRRRRAAGEYRPRVGGPGRPRLGGRCLAVRESRAAAGGLAAGRGRGWRPEPATPADRGSPAWPAGPAARGGPREGTRVRADSELSSPRPGEVRCPPRGLCPGRLALTPLRPAPPPVRFPPSLPSLSSAALPCVGLRSVAPLGGLCFFPRILSGERPPCDSRLPSAEGV